MIRQVRRQKESRPESEPLLTINLKITMPRRVIWIASGFLRGTVTSEAIYVTSPGSSMADNQGLDKKGHCGLAVMERVGSGQLADRR